MSAPRDENETPIKPSWAPQTEVRKFETGATRSGDAGRDDPEGFLSPLVIDRFNEYMTKHRRQADGNLRESDNWQRGMPLATYMKGMWRHFLHLWTRHRGWPVRDAGAGVDIEEDLCAMMFNVQGYLHEILKVKTLTPPQVALTPPQPKEERKPQGFKDFMDKYDDWLGKQPPQAPRHWPEGWVPVRYQW